MKSIVSEKGQVTIPKALRESLAIGPGTELDFVEENGALVGRRIAPRDAIGALVGVLPRADVDATIAQTRGPVWHADLDGKPRDHRRR